MNSRRSLFRSLAGLATSVGALGVAAAMSAITAPVASADDPYVYLPDISTFMATSAQGFPPLYEVLQGTEEWTVPSLPAGESLVLTGVDTQTTFGLFTNDDFSETVGGVGMGTDSIPLVTGLGTEIDYFSFGAGFANEFINATAGTGPAFMTDILITPFGDYTLF